MTVPGKAFYEVSEIDPDERREFLLPPGCLADESSLLATSPVRAPARWDHTSITPRPEFKIGIGLTGGSAARAAVVTNASPQYPSIT
jgi:hypothetical protein